MLKESWPGLVDMLMVVKLSLILMSQAKAKHGCHQRLKNSDSGFGVLSWRDITGDGRGSCKSSFWLRRSFFTAAIPSAAWQSLITYRNKFSDGII